MSVMFRNSSYLALAGERSMINAQMIGANNTANSNTPAFQTRKAIFQDFVVETSKNSQLPDLHFNNDIISYMDTSQGEMFQTNNDLDVAIVGKGYFNIQTPQGIRFTKAGNFTRDVDGTIVTSQGYPVLDNGNAPITLPADTISVDINAKGQVIVNGAALTSLAISDFANEQKLENIGNNLFNSKDVPIALENANIQQGYLARANINAVEQITKFMTFQNDFYALMNAGKIPTELERSTVDDLLRV